MCVKLLSSSCRMWSSEIIIMYRNVLGEIIPSLRLSGW